MRLSDAGLRCRGTKAVYPDHRSPSWPNEDAPRDRSNRLLDHDIGVHAIILRATSDSELSVKVIHHHQTTNFDPQPFSQPGLNCDLQAIALDISDTFRQRR